MSPLILAQGDDDFARFGQVPWWIIVIKVLFVFVFLVVLTLLTIWGERRVVARMQQRLGPNRVGPFGVLQGLADGLKLAFKEDIIPALADKPVYLVAPIASAIPAFLAFSVIPFGPDVSIGGHHTALQLTDLPMAVLFVLAMSSLGIYGVVLAGWASGSTYPLLGGLRSAAQMISYEVAMGLALVPVFLNSGTLSTSGIVAAQGRSYWFGGTLIVSFVIYGISAVGETNRAPFDLPEAESELVGGFHTEYSSLKFALFFLAEYINLITVCAVAVTLFFGGWRAPWPISLWDGANAGWWGMLWFLLKVLVGIFAFIWLRATLPRLRYDQFMKFGWKLLVPISLVWILLVATVREISLNTAARTQLIYAVVGLLVVLLLALALWPAKKEVGEPDGAAEARGLGTFPLPELAPQRPGEPSVAQPGEVTRA